MSMTTQVRGHAAGGHRRRRGFASLACSELMVPVPTKAGSVPAVLFEAGSVPAVLFEAGHTHAGQPIPVPAMKDRSDD
ncbi:MULTISPECIES: hypothetical protein [unclassified Pseudofrankia]|uniref:hypothetical protein n=1 Tax=unclassified Pseudofrankia TaxID=2994372 RepID=UPI0008DAA760|nr:MULTISPECIES: hypothetical protein [unclassified Pseudofrankia]MDT3445258.1 hypothetical protein [Pseudofrankia sp. BMG5.37]OHV53288.1 hypothetical protein BCD48_09685 [Pseudofrankia sp. BMG5.36]